MLINNNYNMKKHSNMKIGGVAKSFIEIEEKKELISLLKNLENYFIIGNGSNTLINDKFLDINFISLKKLKNITPLSNFSVNVEAGLDFAFLIRYMEANNLSGLEELAGIPGTVGGLIYMNGGAYGKEIFDYIERVEILDENNEIRFVDKKDLDISYRHTEIKDKSWIILSADFNFTIGFNKELVKEVRLKRETNQPLTLPNLGSTFKNPEGYFSAKLIIEAGLQGFKIGDAEVSLKHPNFIVNHGEATFNDVVTLVETIQKEIYNKFNIKLEREIIILK